MLHCFLPQYLSYFVMLLYQERILIWHIEIVAAVNDIHWYRKMAESVIQDARSDVNTETEVVSERSESRSWPGGMWYYTKAAGTGVYNGEDCIPVEIRSNGFVVFRWRLFSVV